jgi:hypothetical protein
MSGIRIMPTKNPRINVTLSADMLEMLALHSKRKGQSLSRVAGDFIRYAMESQEDIALARLANTVDVAGMKTYPHQDAWG